MAKPTRPGTPADDGLRIFPHQLKPGDPITVNDVEWEVAAPPGVYLKGKMQTRVGRAAASSGGLGREAAPFRGRGHGCGR